MKMVLSRLVIWKFLALMQTDTNGVRFVPMVGRKKIHLSLADNLVLAAMKKFQLDMPMSANGGNME